MDLELGVLIKCLFSEDCMERQEARPKLVKLGRSIIPYMIGLQYSKDRRISWEAIKILCDLAHPDSIPILVNGIENEDPNVRWLAAEGLIKIGEPSIKPVLLALEMRGGSKPLRESACHVLKCLKEKGIFLDNYNLIGMLKNPAKQFLVAPTAAMIHMDM